MRAIPCETYSRVVGYFSPVRGWHAGKREEFRQRKNYKLPGDTCKQSGSSGKTILSTGLTDLKTRSNSETPTPQELST
ncbi:MAG: anaerobic ribonucleoside-triphosphate reductase [Phycisphaerae bacterium]